MDASLSAGFTQHGEPNPFEVTKAVDFSDLEILETFVQFPGQELVDPRSPMPQVLVGGKGSGRTHLMRNFSVPLQLLRYDSQPLRGAASEGFFGIYLRCTGLNAGRFEGKGVADDEWAEVFPYYMDLWLTQLTLSTAAQLLEAGQPDLQFPEEHVVSEIVALFDGFPSKPQSLGSLLIALREMQRDIDFAVNNAALRRSIDVTVRASRGTLPFAIPRILASAAPELDGVKWLYLIDEFENLTVSQQRYVQTLIREREAPATFLIGAQRAGIRTWQTYSAGTENREGSEFRLIDLEREHLAQPKKFQGFCKSLVAQRLIQADMVKPGNGEGARSDLTVHVDDYFAVAEPQTKHLQVAGERRLAIQRLEEQLRRHRPLGIENEQDVLGIVTALSCSDSDVLEKLNIQMLYRAWSSGKNLRTESAHIREDCEAHRTGAGKAGPYSRALDHWKLDLIAQLRSEASLPQEYLGLDTFIQMAGGLPRNLLIILRNVVRWSLFEDERPFRSGHRIGEIAQRKGVVDSANWFFRDSSVIGERGPEVQQGIGRLADLFRALRFTDKPVEVSLSTFSVDLGSISPRAREVIELSALWSLLLEVPRGQKDRNTRGVVSKYQLNPMLAPRWDLPLSRRGTIGLSDIEANAIFDLSASEQYSAIVKARVKRQTVPFGTRLDQEPMLNIDD